MRSSGINRSARPRRSRTHWPGGVLAGTAKRKVACANPRSDDRAIRPEQEEAKVSQTYHRLAGQRRTRVASLDLCRTLTCEVVDGQGVPICGNLGALGSRLCRVRRCISVNAPGSAASQAATPFP